MPIIKSAKKAARQAVKRTAQNQQTKRAIKLALKEFKAKPSAETLAKVQGEYDKAVKKDLLKKNTASRRKAAIYKIAKAADVKLSATTAAKKATPVTKAAPKKAASKPATKPATKKAPVKKAASAAKPAAKKAPAKKPAAKKTA